MLAKNKLFIYVLFIYSSTGIAYAHSYQEQLQSQQMSFNSKPLENNNSSQTNINIIDNNVSNNTNTLNRTDNHIRSWSKDSMIKLYFDIGYIRSISDHITKVKDNIDLAIVDDKSDEKASITSLINRQLLVRSHAGELKLGAAFKILKFNDNLFDVGLGIEAGIREYSLNISRKVEVDHVSVDNTPNEVMKNTISSPKLYENTNLLLSNKMLAGYAFLGWNISDISRFTIEAGYTQEFSSDSSNPSIKYTSIYESTRENVWTENKSQVTYKGSTYFTKFSLNIGASDSSIGLGVTIGFAIPNFKLNVPCGTSSLTFTENNYKMEMNKKTEESQDPIKNPILFSSSLRLSLSY